jgi:hypothetical protein
VQGHILYNFPSGIWMALDGIYFAGGQTALNGVKSDNEQANTPAGFTLALPVDRNNSLKLSASTGSQPVPEAGSAPSVSLGNIAGAADTDEADGQQIKTKCLGSDLPFTRCANSLPFSAKLVLMASKVGRARDVQGWAKDRSRPARVTAEFGFPVIEIEHGGPRQLR